MSLIPTAASSAVPRLMVSAANVEATFRLILLAFQSIGAHIPLFMFTMNTTYPPALSTPSFRFLKAASEKHQISHCCTGCTFEIVM